MFRRPPSIDLEREVDFDSVVTCLPVIQEVLQGFSDERAYRSAQDAMWALPRVASPLEPAAFEEAVGLYRRARQAGYTVRSGVDCLIAACALRHDVTLLHVDRDFDALSRISSLKVQRARLRAGRPRSDPR